MVHWRPLLLVTIFALLLSACEANSQRQDVGAQVAGLPKAQESSPTAIVSAPAEPGPAISTDSAAVSQNTCPVTTPPDPPFTPPEPSPRSAPGEYFWYGSDSLWTAVPKNGVWSGLPHNPEGFTQKVFWWREGYSWTKEPEPQLTVTGRRLDALAPPLITSKATNAYAGDIGSAMLVGVDFPTTGCWEITGRYADAELSFVVWVGPAQALIRSNRAPDIETVRLIAMSEQATQIAQEESMDVVLRQVDTDLSITDFQFVDSALTKVITVIVPEPDAPADQWYTTVNSVSPLLTHAEPALDLQSLRTGPERVAQAITAHWPGCTLRGIMLYRENDQLTWLAFCNTPEGVASGSMDDQTGVFLPSEAPPASIPVTATPVP